MKINNLNGFGYVSDKDTIDTILSESYVDQTNSVCDSIIQDIMGLTEDTNSQDVIRGLAGLVPDILIANSQVTLINTASMVKAVQEAPSSELALEAVVFAYADEIGMAPIYTEVKEEE